MHTAHAASIPFADVVGRGRCPSHLAGFEMSWSQAARDDLLNRVQLATNL